MKVGIAIGEHSAFFSEIQEELEQHFEISLFKSREIQTPFLKDRVDKYVMSRDLHSLMQWSDVTFFEWATHLLVAATHMPKTCGIICRLHRYELYQWADQINWDAVDRIVMVSDAKRREFSEKYPDHASKVVVISSAVDLDKFQPSQKSFNGDIGILCRVGPRKRVYELLMTFYELIRDGNDFHLHIAGGAKPIYADYVVALKDAISELDLQDMVTFYGNVEDTQSWYKNIDIFISNSYSEGLPAASIEAMASGCFNLSHRWTGADELLPDEYLYYTGNELSEKILQYRDLSEQDRLREKIRMREIACNKFDMNQKRSQIREAIEEFATSEGTNEK